MITAKTLDANTLPDRATAEAPMNVLYDVLNDANFKDNTRFYFDYWNNPSGVAGIREIRIRVKRAITSMKFMPIADKLLKLLPEGSYKIYNWKDLRVIKVYYRSNLRYNPNKYGTMTANNIRYMQKHFMGDKPDWAYDEEGQKYWEEMKADAERKIPVFIQKWESITGRKWEDA